MPEPTKLGLLDALRRLVAERWARIRRKPFDWAGNTARRLHDAAAARIERLAGPDSDIRVRSWHEGRPRDGDGMHLDDLCEHLDRPFFVPDGAVGPAWTELRHLSLGLVDGS